MKKQLPKTSRRTCYRITPRFHIPFLILTTYSIFNVTSTIFTFSYLLKHKYLKENAWLMSLSSAMVLMGFCSDSIIYVFLQKQVREVCFLMLRRKWNTRPSISSVKTLTNFELRNTLMDRDKYST